MDSSWRTRSQLRKCTHKRTPPSQPLLDITGSLVEKPFRQLELRLCRQMRGIPPISTTRQAGHHPSPSSCASRSTLRGARCAIYARSFEARRPRADPVNHRDDRTRSRSLQLYPYHCTQLKHFLGLDVGGITSLLYDMISLLSWDECGKHTIHIFHASFGDCLFDVLRSGHFPGDPLTLPTTMTFHCIRHLQLRLHDPASEGLLQLSS